MQKKCCINSCTGYIQPNDISSALENTNDLYFALGFSFFFFALIIEDRPPHLSKSKVVYMSSKILQLAVASHDLSQAGKEMTVMQS